MLFVDIIQDSNTSKSRLKFTRGEKCIFTHVVLSFSLILIMVIIYLVHLYLVDHTTNTVFSTRRMAPAYVSRLDDVPIGFIYLNVTPILRTCNTLLVRREWSSAPGHCIHLISQPDLSHYLYEWKVNYKDNEGVRIKRSIVHPHFDTDTFENNIGVIYHSEIVGLQAYNLPNTNYQKLHKDDASDGKLIIITWLEDAAMIKDKKRIRIFPAQLLPRKICLVQMAPIVDLRSYETCAVFEKAIYTSLGHGALALQINNLQVFGLFAWGEKLHRTFPFVILNLTHFQEWVEISTTL